MVKKQSNFQLLKIVAMLMIVAHHLVSKNAFNVDTEIVGLTANKLLLQVFGNNAFIGNNLFFLISAWFLTSKAEDSNLLEIVRLCPDIQFDVIGRVNPQMQKVVEQLAKEKNVKLNNDYVTDEEMREAFINCDWTINPIKVRKLLITAGVYESDTAKLVRQTFHSFRETQDYSTAVTSTMAALQLSRPSVTSYLPYAKGVYFPETAEAENISAGAERQRHYRAVVELKKNPCEVNLWKCVVAFRGYKFKTLSGLPFTYKLKKGREDEFTKELWIDRREDSKSLAWSSVVLAYHNIGEIGEVVDRPKALGDIRGVSYIYGLFYRFGLIDVPEKVQEKMKK